FFTRVTEDHSLLRGTCHLRHQLLQSIDFEVGLQGIYIHLHNLNVTLFGSINLLEGTPLEVINSPSNLQGREGRKVEKIGLEVLDVVESVLHSDQVFQRTHGPEVILS